MRPPAYLIKKGVKSLPCIGDGRQSGTSGSPSILNASPEAATGGGLALLAHGRSGPDRPQQALGRHPDLGGGDGEAASCFRGGGRLQVPGEPDAWQEIQRGIVDELSNGMVLKPAVKYQRVHKTKGIPRDNH